MENIENKVVTESQSSSEEKQSSLKTFSKKDNNAKKNLSNQNEQINAFEERTVEIKRISKTTKGGRVMRFSALVVVGDKKGTVGFGMGKSNEVPDAIKKAIKNANNNLFKIKMNKRGTVYHEVNGKHGASKIIIKPAPVGKGIVAGGAARAVIELAGFQDIYSKSLGSNTKINVIRATVNGLLSQLSPSEISKARGKDVKDL
ncbi:MAG: 30S ribosomal protein S5 [Candidatus Ureaplasma intestinipullorum]|uniref:Small ribosomal subunit protein uS5 n=1 Tax=Candidatus Ureaplasma intestinipullorum TaxID=2838770 RepID=A0A9E2KWV4_9BACT|nr:30S ribosomal protein S5 [Candidatus Ureaplasma intestinipullorum]